MSPVAGFAEAIQQPGFALALLNASSDAIMLVDLDGKVIAVNPASLRILQLGNPDEVLGRSWDSLWDEKDRLLVRDGLEAASAGASTTFEGCRQSRWLRVIVEPVRDESGHVRCLLACAHDVTDRRQNDVEARFPQDEKLKLFDRLVGEVVHDFRNIFASVHSAARILRRRVTDAPALEIVSHLERAVERGCALSAQLLDFTRDDNASCDALSPRDIVAQQAAMKPESGSPTKTAPPTDEF